MRSRSFWRGLNPDEATFDLLLIGSVILGAYVLDLAATNPGTMVTIIAYLFPAFMIPWYLGDIVARYAESDLARLTKWIIGVLIASQTAAFFYRTIRMAEVIPDAWQLPAHGAIFALGCAMGILAGVSRMHPREDERDRLEVIFLGVVLLFGAPVGGWIALKAWGFEVPDWLAVAGMIVVMQIEIVAFVLYLLKVHPRISQTPDYARIRRGGREYLYPVLVATAFIGWNWLEQTTLREAGASFGERILWLTLTGFLPFRLVLLLAPHIRAGNLALGGCMLFCMFL